MRYVCFFVLFSCVIMSLYSSLAYSQDGVDLTEAQVLEIIFGNHYRSEIDDNTLIIGTDNTRRGVYAIWSSPPERVRELLGKKNKPHELIVKVAKMALFPNDSGRLFVQLYTNIPNNNAHWSIPVTSFATFTKSKESWQLDNFTQYSSHAHGQYGLSFPFEKIIPLGDIRIGIVMHQYVDGQGYFKDITSIYSEIDKEYQRVFSFIAEEKNPGACKTIKNRSDRESVYLGTRSNANSFMDPNTHWGLCAAICWGYISNLGVIRSNSVQNWSDFIVLTTGTKMLFESCDMETYVYELTRYTYSKHEQKYIKGKQ